jgi:hypothetical protein
MRSFVAEALRICAPTLLGAEIEVPVRDRSPGLGERVGVVRTSTATTCRFAGKSSVSEPESEPRTVLWLAPSMTGRSGGFGDQAWARVEGE